MRRCFIWIGMGLFAALFLLSGYQIFHWYQDRAQSRQEFESVSALVGNGMAGNGLFGGANDGVQPILGEYLALCAENADFAGWISIEGTKIDYPVMQTPDDPDFYLKHNFEKQYRVSGVPYLQYDCDILSSDNLVIYGHSMKDGSMFTNLKKYRNAAFYREHPTILFNNKYSYGTYEVIAAFSTTADEDGFAFQAFVNAEDEAGFDAYVAKCKELTPYDIETTAHYGDKLITLATCEYTHKNGRMVVVAKQI